MKQSKRGVALIWALVTSTVLLIVSSTMANYIFKESGMSLRIDSSVAAYAAAKSGIELGKYCADNVGLTGKDCALGINNLNDSTTKGPFKITESSFPDTTYTVVFTNLGTGKIKIESTGNTNGVSRKIEFTSQNEDWENIDYPFPVLTSTGSFALQFDFWLSAITVGNFTVNVGSAANNIALSYNATAPKTISLVSGTDSSAPISLTSVASNLTSSYILQGRIEYIDGYSARLIISKRDPATQALSCIGSTVLNLSGKANGWFPTSPTIFGSGSMSSVQLDPSSTDTTIKMLVGTDNVYIDNVGVKGL